MAAMMPSREAEAREGLSKPPLRALPRILKVSRGINLPRTPSTALQEPSKVSSGRGRARFLAHIALPRSPLTPQPPWRPASSSAPRSSRWRSASSCRGELRALGQLSMCLAHSLTRGARPPARRSASAQPRGPGNNNAGGGGRGDDAEPAAPSVAVQAPGAADTQTPTEPATASTADEGATTATFGGDHLCDYFCLCLKHKSQAQCCALFPHHHSCPVTPPCDAFCFCLKHKTKEECCKLFPHHPDCPVVPPTPTQCICVHRRVPAAPRRARRGAIAADARPAAPPQELLRRGRPAQPRAVRGSHLQRVRRPRALLLRQPARLDRLPPLRPRPRRGLPLSAPRAAQQKFRDRRTSLRA